MIYKEIESPFTNGKANLQRKANTLSFRKSQFEIQEHYYVCEDTKEEFTTSELDIINLNQVYNQYRDKFGLPFPDQIKSIREKYGVSASKMSEILGLGTNTYRLYEQGEVPSVGNGRLIIAAEYPFEFGKFLRMSQEVIGINDYKKLTKKVDDLIRLSNLAETSDSLISVRKLFEKIVPDEYTGYRLPSLEKISHMILFFAERTQTWTTKLNKLFFYSDFLAYKNTGYGVSGLTYCAYPMGPVPINYKPLYSKIGEGDLVKEEYTTTEHGHYGAYFAPMLTFNEFLFSQIELEIMDKVTKEFKWTRIPKIIEISHDELAWKENKESREIISYKDYGFRLNAI